MWINPRGTLPHRSEREDKAFYTGTSHLRLKIKPGLDLKRIPLGVSFAVTSFFPILR